MPLPLPPLQLSATTGPQVTDGRTNVTTNTTFGGGFFDRGAGAGALPGPAVLIAFGALALWLVASGRLKV